MRMRAEAGKKEGTGTNGNEKMGGGEGEKLREGKEGRRDKKKKNRKEIEEDEVCVKDD